MMAGVGHAFADIPKEIGKESQQAWEGIKGDVTAPVTGPKGKPPGWLDYAARAGKTGLDVLGYGTGWPVIQGAATSIVGRPVEKLTGIPREYTGAAAALAVPVAGEIDTLYNAGRLTRAARELMGTAKLPPAMQDAAKAVEKVLSPTSISPEAGQTERTIRRATGEASLATEKSAHELVHYSPIVSNLPVPEQRALVDYIENRSSRGNLPDPGLQKAADAISNVYDRYKGRITDILGKSGQVPNFINDYYAHLWKEKPSIVGEKLGAFFRQGSGRSLKQRTIPTIAEGIEAGLTPKFENPIESTMAYARNMSNFLATHDIQNELKDLGYAKFARMGDQPQGWVPLDGIMTNKAVGYADKAGEPQAHTIQMYAPEPVARIYNNFISKGLEQGDAAPFWRGARLASNGLTMLKLGLSTFHLSTMANEGIISEVARGIQAASRGEMKTAGKAIGGAAAAPVRSVMRGMKLQRQLLDSTQEPDAISAAVNKAFVRSGSRVRMDPFYRTRASGSFFNAIEKGTFKRELGDAVSRIFGRNPSMLDRAKGTVDLAANVIQSTAAPIFEKFVPLIKQGAFASRMEDFVKANPGASQADLDKYAIKLSDSIDNRFGELIQDNLFWHRQMKQIAQILLLSPTWNLGTIREIGGGIRDLVPSAKGILKGKGITDRTAYVAALAAVTALENGIATYLKTGEAPHGKDFMAYRTGGIDPKSGQPERAQIPGYQKDVYAFGYDFPHHILPELVNKLNPGLSTAAGLIQNKDYRGLPIYRPEGAAPVPGEPTMWDYMLEQAMPISLGQNFPKSSKITPFERYGLAVRPSPSYIQSPERMEMLRRKYDTKDWRRRIRADQRQKAQGQ